MSDKSFAEVYKTNFLWHWGKINEIKKPIIAAVNGYAVNIVVERKEKKRFYFILFD